MFKKPCPCGCGKPMGSADRRWGRAMLDIQRSLESFRSHRDWLNQPHIKEAMASEGPLHEHMLREVTTFINNGSRMVNEIDGWIHHRMNVHLPAAKIGMLVREGPGMVAALKEVEAEVDQAIKDGEPL